MLLLWKTGSGIKSLLYFLFVYFQHWVFPTIILPPYTKAMIDSPRKGLCSRSSVSDGGAAEYWPLPVWAGSVYEGARSWAVPDRFAAMRYAAFENIVPTSAVPENLEMRETKACRSFYNGRCRQFKFIARCCFRWWWCCCVGVLFSTDQYLDDFAD